MNVEWILNIEYMLKKKRLQNIEGLLTFLAIELLCSVLDQN